MKIPVLERRRTEQLELIERARGFATALDTRLGGAVQAAIVIGSVARGDWNKWSDIDVLVVTHRPVDASPAELSIDPAFPGVQAVVWSEPELARRRTRRDPIAVEADSIGVVVLGSR